MKNFNFKWLLLSFVLSVAGISQVWGYEFQYPFIYFNNSNADGSQRWDKVMILFGHNSNSQGMALSQISNTNLWFVKGPDWGTSLGNLGYGFSDLGAWDYEATGIDSRWTSLTSQTSNYTGKVKDNASYNLTQNTYYFTSSGTNNLEFTKVADNGNWPENTLPRYSAWLRVRLSEDGGSSYPTYISEGDWPCSLTLQGTKIKRNGNQWSSDTPYGSRTGDEAASATTSGYQAEYTNIIVTGLVTMTLNSISNSAYEFAGWGTGDTPSSTDDTKEYHITANTLYYAFFKRKQYRVTFEPKGTYGTSTVTAEISSSGITSGDLQNYGSDITITATPAKGYEIVGWYSDATCETEIDGTSSSTTSITVDDLADVAEIFVKFRGKTYATITLDRQGGTSGDASITSITSGSTYSSIDKPTKNGYHFMGYFSLTGGNGTKYFNADGTPALSDNIWEMDANISESTPTLYAYYVTPTISSLTFTPTRVMPLGEVKVTPVFDYEPEGTYSFCYKVTLGDSPYTRMQVQPEFTPTGVNIGEVTFEAPSAAHTYALEVRLYNEASHDCSSDGSPVATYNSHGQTFVVEAANAVTVEYKSGSAEVRSSTTVYATEDQTTATVTAPTIPGLTFTSWTYDAEKITATGGTSFTTNPIIINASEATTLTANYSQGPLFFKKPAGWEHVYIYFYSSTGYWRNPTEGDKREGTGSKSGWGITDGPIELTNIVEGTTDVYYYDLITNPTCVAFSDLSMSDYEYFAKVGDAVPNIVRVTSFDSNNPMIVPTGSGTLRNQSTARYFDYDKVPLLTNWGWTFRSNADSWVATHKLVAEKMGDLTFSTKIYLSRASYNYEWRLYASDNKTPYGKAGTPVLNYDNPTSATLVKNEGNLWIKTNIPGYYTFTATYGTGTTYLGNNITVTVTYPVNVDDYRLLYDDDNLNPHPSSIIHKRNNGKDTVSMFYDPDHNPILKMQQCDDISTSESDDVDPTTWTSTTISLSSFSSVLTKAGVYNFIIQQDASGENPTIVKIEPYTGRFYVRTDCVDDKWEYQKSKDKHTMTYSDYSTTLTTNPYSHYYVKDVDAESNDVNIRFTVATDYSEAICDTVFNGDANDTWGNESINRRQKLNVRFTYNQETNKVWRAYTEGPANDEYMVLRTDNSHVFKTADGSAIDTLRFKDMGNWVYQVDAYATVGSYVKLTANAHYYGGGDAQKTQYIKGNSSSGYTSETAVLLLGGSSGSREHMRITYDFKTDRMVTSWLPSHTVSGTLSINADVMLKRTHQGAGESITFSTNESKLDNVKTVYGVMEFQKSYITDDSYSRYVRDLYWISFPFDVKLSDVFGFGTYGTHWIIEYYDGKGRAEHGFWADSEPNWKFVMPDKRKDFTLKANEGYILALDLDEMTESSSVWTNVTTVYLYFPSHANVEDITQATSKTFNISQDGYLCGINRSTGTEGDRRIKDSYWHCIGVPSFANSTRTDAATTDPSDATWSSTIPYVYKWNPTDNSLSVYSDAGSFRFDAMHSYLVQYNCTTITWTNIVIPKVSSVLARKTDENESVFREFKLDLQRNEESLDHTYVRMTNNENVTEEFDFSQDLCKELNPGANIYTYIGYERAAGNCIPFPTTTTTVPVGVKVVANGEYTFSMPEGTNGENVVLIDNAYGTRTNLGLMPYTVTLTAGTYDSRFVLEFAPIQDSPTSLENDGLSRSDELNDANDDVRKVFVGGRLYIIRDGKVYDAAGQRVE